jgi:uncharacterized cupredoxin-like copper-binding protein
MALICAVLSAMLNEISKGSMPHMKKPPVIAILPGLLAIALAACGGASGPSTSIKVTMTDFAFSPNAFTVPAGQEISLEITNNGAVTHSFIIMQAGHQVEDHFTDADKANMYWEASPIPPGESVKTTFTSPGEPGEYQVVCGIAGHFEAGMAAKLNVVKEP